MYRYGFRPSVCPIRRPLQQHAAGLLLSDPRAGDVERLLPAPGTRQQHGAAAANA